MPLKFDLRAELAVGRHALHRGRVCEVAEWIADRPRRLPALIELLWDDDPGIASRAADVLERITHQPSPSLLHVLTDYKQALLGLLADSTIPKVRWNLALTLPRLTLTVPECRRMAAVLATWLDDRSSIVKTAALHATAMLTRQDPTLLPDALDMLRIAGRSGTPAMRARSRILLKRMASPSGNAQKRGSLHLFD